MPLFLTLYLAQLKDKVRTWAYSEAVAISKEWINVKAGTGFVRLRIEMTNGDLLEIAEYLTLEDDTVVVNGYRYHWQDPDGQLIKRWDNAAHHPNIEGFPHHLHDGSEGNVVPGLADINAEKALALISRQLVLREERND